LWEIRVLIQHIIEIGDLPAELRLVCGGKYLEYIEPSHLGLHADNVLDELLVSGPKKDG
jgi:hypothetical protein